MEIFRKNSYQVYLFLTLAVILLLLAVLLFWPSLANTKNYDYSALVNKKASTTPQLLATTTPVTHLKTPSAVRAVYLTACAASNKMMRDRVIKLATETQINSIIINIKDETGKISIKTDNPLFIEAYRTAGCPVPNMKEIVAELHQKNIYAIARIAVFQDPDLVKKHPEWAVKRASDGGVWKDRKGISWLEVKATPVWDYTAELAKESYKLGFDEINFDYVRFPSDGNMLDIAYSFYQPSQETRAQALRSFFAGLRERLKDLGAPLSVDLFGMTCTNYDDLGIGQVLEDALPYFDYVAPMVYPSHYPPGYNGYAKPATVPYQIIKYNLDIATTRATVASSSPSKIRPWIQDFDLGADYTAEMIRAQIKATTDAGLNSYMVWDPRNVYTREAYVTIQPVTNTATSTP